MESKKQIVKNQIISDLRAGRISRQLVGLILGDGGYRLMRRELDHIFEWMMMNTDEWRVAEKSDSGRFIVVFGTSPFHPENWDDIDTYKNVMRQMFGDHGTKDFKVYRASMSEANRIWQNLKDLRKTEEPARVAGFDYVRMALGGEKVLAMVTYVNDNNGKLVVILSGTRKGLKYWATSNEAMEVISDDVAISELVRLKEEWKNEKRKQSQEATRIEFREKYGNIVRGSYLKKGDALYIVESVDMDAAKVTAVRLLAFGPYFPAGEKCELYLVNDFTLIAAEEAAEILLKEYSNE